MIPRCRGGFILLAAEADRSGPAHAHAPWRRQIRTRVVSTIRTATTKRKPFSVVMAIDNALVDSGS